MATPPDRAIALIRNRALTAYVAVADDCPRVTPVWYVCHDGRLEFFARGPILDAIRKNPTVAVTIPTEKSGYSDWHIDMRGEATVIEEPERINETAARLFPKYIDGGREQWGVGNEKHTSHPDDVLVVVEPWLRGT